MTRTSSKPSPTDGTDEARRHRHRRRGVYASKPRPALIIQDDRFDATDSLTVCPFTSTEVDAPLLRLPVTADEANGLGQDCCLMVDKLTTVSRSNVRSVVGRLEATTLVEVERRLLVFLGFGA